MTRHYHDFKLLKQTITIHQVLTAYGVDHTFRTRGDRLVGPCPIHGGDNPNAFVVSLSRNLWHCFSGCKRGGDVIDLARFLGNLDYSEAGAFLASLKPVPPMTRSHTPAPARHRSRPPEPFTPYTRRLPLDPRAPLLHSKQIKPATALHFDTGAYYGRGFLHGCIGVRLHDLDGRPLGYAGRRLALDDAALLGKWKLPPRFPKSSTLYSFHRVASDLDSGLCLVECPWSVMRLHQLGIPAVALLGSSLSQTQHRLLQHVPRLVLLLDGDHAGRQAARRIHSTLCGATNVRVVDLPDSLDPDDLDDTDLVSRLRPVLPV